jgi:hypothetical protein
MIGSITKGKIGNFLEIVYICDGTAAFRVKSVSVEKTIATF